MTDYAALAVAGWIGEETCVAFYEYYHYAVGWHVRLDRVPILVPLIWPLVFAIVAFGASLVEVIAVRAGLWSWAEAGHLGVPIIGILGWGYFAIGADLALSGRLSSGDGRIRRALATIVAAPLVAHVLIQITWWGFSGGGPRRCR